MLKHVAFKRMGNLFVQVYDSQTPTDEEWNVVINAYREYDVETGGRFHEAGFLIFSDGGGPNSAQRRQLRDLLQGRIGKVSLITDSLVIQGTIAAVNLVIPGGMKVFSSRDWRKGLEWCQISEAQLPEILKVALALRHEVTESKLLSKLEM